VYLIQTLLPTQAFSDRVVEIFGSVLAVSAPPPLQAAHWCVCDTDACPGAVAWYLFCQLLTLASEVCYMVKRKGGMKTKREQATKVSPSGEFFLLHVNGNLVKGHALDL